MNYILLVVKKVVIDHLGKYNNKSVNPRFWNFNSEVPVDVNRVKSYVDSFLDPA